jgi:hypothetical protein
MGDLEKHHHRTQKTGGREFPATGLIKSKEAD